MRAIQQCASWRTAGSNPTPATTCENGPLARILGYAGRFFSVPWCVILSRCGPLCRGVHGRIADGIGALGRSVRTVGYFTDGHGRAMPAACRRLNCAAKRVIAGASATALMVSRPLIIVPT